MSSPRGSVPGGLSAPGVGCLLPEGSAPGGGVCSWGVSAPGECLLLGGVCSCGVCLVETPLTAIAEGGTQPTGMHSAFIFE